MKEQLQIDFDDKVYIFTDLNSAKLFCLNAGILNQESLDLCADVETLDDVLFSVSFSKRVSACRVDCNQGLDQSQQKVREFHEAFNHPVSDKVVMLSKERMEKRVNWLQEEVSELLEAQTPEDTADAIGDIIYLALGTAVEAGIQMNEVFNFICNANMRKLGADGKPIYKEDNKIAKPEGWYGPEKEIKEYLNNFNRTTI